MLRPSVTPPSKNVGTADSSSRAAGPAANDSVGDDAAAGRQAGLEMANEVYRALLAGGSFAAVARLVVDRLDRLLGGTAATLYIVEEESWRIQAPLHPGAPSGTHATLVIDGNGPSAASSPQPASARAGASAEHRQALARGEVVAIGDTRRDPRCVGFGAALGGPLAAALLDQPVLLDGNLAAVLHLAAGQPRVWTAGEKAIAREAGLALAAALARQAQERRRGEREAELRASRDRERQGSDEAARRLSAAIEQTGEMLLIVSRSGVLQYANPAYCNAAGAGAERLLGRPAFHLPLAPREARRPLRAALRAGRVWHGLFSVAGPDGAMHEIEATVSPVRGEGGDTSSFVCVGRDVTEPRRLEAIADAANMVDQVGFVFATLRHELGNPINSVKTALSVLHRNLADYSPDAVAHYLERSLAEISRMEYLLRAFKTFGAFERPQLEPVVASHFLGDFARLVGPDLERRGIRLETRIDADLGLARLDPRAFNQALLNLVTNAADAVAGCALPRVRIVAQRRGRRLEIRVEDNGAGVAEADLPNLFKPFFTTKRGGTGLGLAIVRKLLSKMESTIEVHSQRGVATVFTLSLPVAEAP